MTIPFRAYTWDTRQTNTMTAFTIIRTRSFHCEHFLALWYYGHMVGLFRDDLTAFRRLVPHSSNILAMGYLNSEEVEVRERVCTILQDFGDPLNKDYLGNLDILFDKLDTLPRESSHRMFITVQQILDKNNALKHDEKLL